MANKNSILCCTFSASGHSATLLQGLSVLRAQGQLLDVVLAINEERFQVHRAVLAACSDYFRSVRLPRLPTHRLHFILEALSRCSYAGPFTLSARREYPAAHRSTGKSDSVWETEGNGGWGAYSETRNKMPNDTDSGFYQILSVIQTFALHFPDFLMIIKVLGTRIP